MTAAISDPQARRNLFVLVTAQALLGAQMPIHFTLGGLSGQMLSSNPCWATLPISMTVLGSMLTAPWLSEVMQRFGRRVGFLIGAAAGSLASLICALALLQGSFAVFLFGSLLFGVYMSAQGFFRFAAADAVSGDGRPKAISYVMAGGLAAAVIGPQMFKITENTLSVPFMGAYLAIVGLNMIGALVFIWLRLPPPTPKGSRGPYTGRTRMELLRSPRISVAIICAMVSYSLMNLVMTSTPLAVVGCGFTPGNSADVVMAHVLGMFAPAFFTGHLIARFGVERVIGAGLLILALSGVVALSGITLGNFFVALILLGIGWNFGFIGATAMLTQVQRPEEQGRIQGMNDFCVFGLVTIASVSSGTLMNCSGSGAEAGWALVNYAMVPFLVVAGLALGWYLKFGRVRAAAE